MRKFNKGFLVCLVTMIALGICAVSFADTEVVTTSTRAPYFHTGAGPVASIFYWIGDIVVLPFRLLGDLFSGLL